MTVDCSDLDGPTDHLVKSWKLLRPSRGLQDEVLYPRTGLWLRFQTFMLWLVAFFRNLSLSFFPLLSSMNWAGKFFHMFYLSPSHHFSPPEFLLWHLYSFPLSPHWGLYRTLFGCWYVFIVLTFNFSLKLNINLKSNWNFKANFLVYGLV